MITYEDWARERMAAYVIRELHTLPAMRPLLGGSLQVEHGADPIVAVVLQDRREVAAHVYWRSWWEVGTQTAGDRAFQVAVRVAGRLSEKWRTA